MRHQLKRSAVKQRLPASYVYANGNVGDGRGGHYAIGYVRQRACGQLRGAVKGILVAVPAPARATVGDVPLEAEFFDCSHIALFLFLPFAPSPLPQYTLNLFFSLENIILYAVTSGIC
jgi:hypothetical protein